MTIKKLFLAAMLSTTASSSFSDELADAASICRKHVTYSYLRQVNPTDPLHVSHVIAAPGWEHCLAILTTSAARDQATRDSDEAQNPDLKSTRELARKIGAQP